MTENNEYAEIKQHVGESFLIEGLIFSVGWYKNPLTTKEEDNAIMVKCMELCLKVSLEIHFLLLYLMMV